LKRAFWFLCLSPGGNPSPAPFFAFMATAEFPGP
jgi:hypothetical protein